MQVVPPMKYEEVEQAQSGAPQGERLSWMDVAAGGALLAGGLLLLAGKKRAGTVVGAAGAALILFEQREMVEQHWKQLPSYIDRVQGVVGQVQEAVEEMEEKREKLHTLLHR